MHPAWTIGGTLIGIATSLVGVAIAFQANVTASRSLDIAREAHELQSKTEQLLRTPILTSIASLDPLSLGIRNEGPAIAIVYQADMGFDDAQFQTTRLASDDSSRLAWYREIRNSDLAASAEIDSGSSYSPVPTLAPLEETPLFELMSSTGLIDSDDVYDNLLGRLFVRLCYTDITQTTIDSLKIGAVTANLPDCPAPEMAMKPIGIRSAVQVTQQQLR